MKIFVSWSVRSTSGSFGPWPWCCRRQIRYNHTSYKHAQNHLPPSLRRSSLWIQQERSHRTLVPQVAFWKWLLICWYRRTPSQRIHSRSESSFISVNMAGEIYILQLGTCTFSLFIHPFHLRINYYSFSASGLGQWHLETGRNIEECSLPASVWGFLYSIWMCWDELIWQRTRDQWRYFALGG